MIWDGGAEGTGISDKCLSRLLRDREAVQLGKYYPMHPMACMVHTRRIFSYSDNSKKNNERKVVDILGPVILTTED